MCIQYDTLLCLYKYTYTCMVLELISLQMYAYGYTYTSVVEITVRNWSAIFEDRTFCRSLIFVPLKMYSNTC